MQEKKKKSKSLVIFETLEDLAHSRRARSLISKCFLETSWYQEPGTILLRCGYLAFLCYGPRKLAFPLHLYGGDPRKDDSA